MAEELIQSLAHQVVEQFKPTLQYSEDGDFITYFFRDVECFGERVDKLLTVYMSLDGKDLVGCKVKGVARILGELGSFGVHLNDANAKLSLLFLGGIAVASPGATDMAYYRKLAEWTREVSLGEELIRCAA